MMAARINAGHMRSGLIWGDDGIDSEFILGSVIWGWVGNLGEVLSGVNRGRAQDKFALP